MNIENNIKEYVLQTVMLRVAFSRRHLLLCSTSFENPNPTSSFTKISTRKVDCNLPTVRHKQRQASALAILKVGIQRVKKWSAQGARSSNSYSLLSERNAVLAAYPLARRG